VLRKVYDQNFEDVIGGYFNELNDKKTENLILDLRNNQGGDISNGTFLLSHLMDTSFRNIEAYYKVDNSQSNFALKKTYGESLGNHEPKQKVFKGKLFVIINGGSFSNSGIVAACLKKYNRAVFIGEETGGNSKVLAGNADDYYLPNTDILIEIPTKQYMLGETVSLTGRGIMADYPFQPSLKDILENIDSTLNFTYEIMNKE
jgi:C-terminal processing protease CtpA/Prc